MKFTDLNEDQRACIKAYAKCGDKVQAYTQTLATPGQSKQSIVSRARAFFKKPEIAFVVEEIEKEALIRANIQMEEIVHLMTEEMVQKKVELETSIIDAAWVLTRTAALANFNIRKFLTTDTQGNAVYDFRDATDLDWYCISEFTVDTIGKYNGDIIPVERVKLKAYDKLKALEMVGKHIQVKAFDDSVTIKGDPQAPIKTQIFFEGIDCDGNSTKN